jgi:hypothetical protein
MNITNTTNNHKEEEVYIFVVVLAIILLLLYCYIQHKENILNEQVHVKCGERRLSSKV